MVDDVPTTDTIRPLVTLDLDHVDTDEIVHVADWSGPAVTLEIDSRRHGVVAPDGPRRAKSLIDRARRTLEHATLAGEPVPASVTRDIVTRLLAIGGDPETWRHGADGTLIIATPEHIRVWRTGPVTLDRVDVTTSPRIRPLLRLTGGVGPFTLVALSLDRVRILRGDTTTLEEIPLGRTPRSIAEALWFLDDERRLGEHSTGTGNETAFHGHAAGAEHTNVRVHQFISMVDAGLVDVLRQRHALGQPVIVAGVAEHLATMRQVTALPDLVDDAIPGNHESHSDRDLHRRAVDLLAGRHNGDTALARHARLAGTGLTIENLAELPGAASQGRIDQLLVADGVEHWPADGDLADETIDRIIVETLRHGGEVVEVAPDTLGEGQRVAALARW